MKDVQGGLRWLGRATKVLPFLPTVSTFSVAALEAKLDRAGFDVAEHFAQAPGIVFLVATKRS